MYPFHRQGNRKFGEAKLPVQGHPVTVLPASGDFLFLISYFLLFSLALIRSSSANNSVPLPDTWESWMSSLKTVPASSRPADWSRWARKGGLSKALWADLEGQAGACTAYLWHLSGWARQCRVNPQPFFHWNR